MTYAAPRHSANNALNALRAYGTIVADSSDFKATKAFKLVDATANPTLSLQAAQALENASLPELFDC